MDRRDSLKTLLVGTIAGAVVVSSAGCGPDGKPLVTEDIAAPKADLYGRTPAEAAWDEKINGEIYLNEHELGTIAVLCDIILPKTDTAGSANDANVPDFIDFIVKDIPSHQLPIRGGLMWLDNESNKRFNTEFSSCTSSQQIEIIDDIAYPDDKNENPDMAPGRKFFNRMRNLTLTGYYTTRIGINDLGYVGNMPNVWDGVPADVLAEHDVDYDPEWLAKCVDQEKRGDIAVWDDDMNLIS